MTSRPRRARRCQLSVPGSREKMLEKAAGLDLDHVFLDLEDAVAPSAKPGARGKIVDALHNFEWKPRTLCVRINDVETQWCHDDIIDVVTGAGTKLDTIMLTKAKRVEDVMFVHQMSRTCAFSPDASDAAASSAARVPRSVEKITVSVTARCRA